MQLVISNSKKINYHTININNNYYKIINQLNEDKNISNFYLPKKLVKPHLKSNNSYKIKIYDKFICVPKKMCFLDKTKKHYLVGIDMFFTYWIYNITDNTKYRLIGYKAIEDLEIRQLHYITISERCFDKEKKINPFLSSYNNYSEARKKILKQIQVQKISLQKFISNNYFNKKIIDNKFKKSKLPHGNYITKYNKCKFKPPHPDILKDKDILNYFNEYRKNRQILSNKNININSLIEELKKI